MEKLKSVLADKIIEISSNGGDDVKVKLEKVNYFRDFAGACQTLMSKYPAIEDEFIQMVNNNDFNTKVAASRVDTIIRLSQNEAQTNTQPQTDDISKLEEIKEQEQEELVEEEFLETLDNQHIYEEGIPQYLPEDIEYEEIVLDDDASTNKYAEFEHIDEAIVPENSEVLLSSEPVKENNSARNEKLKRGIQIVGAIIAIVVLIFVIVFIINNWKTILYVLSGVAVVGLIIWMLIRKNRKK